MESMQLYGMWVPNLVPLVGLEPFGLWHLALSHVKAHSRAEGWGAGSPSWGISVPMASLVLE